MSRPKGEIRNVQISRTMLGREDHLIPTCVISTEGDHSSQGFGTHNLSYKNYGVDYLMRVIEVVTGSSTGRWEDLPGKYCRIDASMSKIFGIGHITEDKWFYPAEDLSQEEKGE